MNKIQVLLYIVVAFDLSCAVVPNNKVKFRIFEEQTSRGSYEQNVYQSLQSSKSLLAQKGAILATDSALLGLSLIPFLGSISTILRVVRNTLAEESDWRLAFTKAITKERRRDITEDNVRWIESEMKTFQKLLPLLNETNPELENRKTIATIFHTKFHELLYFFDRNDSLFKKFALTSSPLLVSFSYMIALFTPIAKKLIPQVEKNTQLACKMRDVLEPYVPLVVYERLSRHIYAYGVEHNHAFLFKVMAKPFNENGYNTELRIDEGCDGGWMEYYDTHGEHCLYDDLNEVRYHYPANQAETAYVDYGSLVRHRVEEYFPMKTLKSLCVGATSKTKTGFGWVTIIISEVFAYSLPNGDDCDSLGDRCDPYVKLFVDGEMVQSAPRSNTNRFDPDLSFVSKKLTKEKTIKIELWDDDSTAFGRGSDDLIFRTEGTVESFLKDGKRSSGKSKGVTQSHANEVYLIAIWRDEYK